MQKVLPSNAPPKLRGNRIARIGCFALANSPLLIIFLLLWWEWPVNEGMPLAAAAVLVGILANALVGAWWSYSGKCPSCNIKMPFQREILVVDDWFGVRTAAAWNVLRCPSCNASYRVRNRLYQPWRTIVPPSEYAALVDQDSIPSHGCEIEPPDAMDSR